MSERRAALPADERARRSHAACALLGGVPEFTAARVVSGFVALRAEIDPAEALAAAAARGATVVLPRVGTGSPRLRFHAASGALRPGAYGVLEPDASAPEVPLDRIDVFVVPGLAFDDAGRRLGYGGGYFDELTAQARARRPVFVAALAYDFQLVPDCPAGEGDALVDCVVTDAQVLRPGGRG